jgi:hypothetical protein
MNSGIFRHPHKMCRQNSAAVPVPSAPLLNRPGVFVPGCTGPTSLVMVMRDTQVQRIEVMLMVLLLLMLSA